MKRILLVLSVAALMAAMLAVSASAAFAEPKTISGLGAQFKGAVVLHCGPAFGAFGTEGVKGNEVGTPNGDAQGSGCRGEGIGS